MKFARPILLVVILFSLVYTSAYSQGTAPESINTILAQAKNAVGTSNDIARVRSISADADCVGPKGKYTTSILSFRDSKTLFSQTYSYKDRPLRVMINGDVVWETETAAGEPVISTPFQRMASRAHEYQKMAIDPASFFRDMEVVGDEVFEGQASIMIRAKNELGMTTHLFFDKGNKRFNGYTLLVPGSDETIRNVVLEWRKVGSLTLPSVVKAVDKSGEWKLSFHTIRFNTANEKLLDVPPRIADMAELLRMHEQQKTAHLTYNAEMLLGDSPETPVSVQRGNVVKRSRADDLARFKAYFSSFRILEWEDIVPPVIKISKDGSMATKIVQKRVRGVTKDASGKETTEHTIFAWLEVLEKVDGKWRLVTIASTEKDGPK